MWQGSGKNKISFLKKFRFQSKFESLIDRKLWINIHTGVKRHKINYISGKRYSREKIKIIIDVAACRVGICFGWLAGWGTAPNTPASLQGGWRRKWTLKWRRHLEAPCCRYKEHSVFPSSGKQISFGLSQPPYVGLEFFEFILIFDIFYLTAPWIRYLLKKIVIAKQSQILCLLLPLKLYIHI